MPEGCLPLENADQLGAPRLAGGTEGSCFVGGMGSPPKLQASLRCPLELVRKEADDGGVAAALSRRMAVRLPLS